MTDAPGEARTVSGTASPGRTQRSPDGSNEVVSIHGGVSGGSYRRATGATKYISAVSGPAMAMSSKTASEPRESGTQAIQPPVG